MGKCEYLIAQAITENCDDPLVKGLEKRGIIINRDDVDFGSVEFAADKSNVVSALPLLSGKKAFEIYQPGNTPFTGSNSALATGTNRNTFTHQIVMYIPDSGPDVAESIIDPLANGSFLVILENKFKKMQGTPAGAAAFEIYGFYQGLVAMLPRSTSTATIQTADGHSHFRRQDRLNRPSTCSLRHMRRPKR